MAQKKINYSDDSFIINYEMINNDKEKTILFLHGWGSNKEIMKQAFGNYFKEYKHIYIDMPGFGKSPTEKVLKTVDYKNIVHSFLEEIKEEPVAIFGHSFGGKVATLLNPKNLVLLSTSGILEPKPFSVRARIALFKILKPLGGEKLWKNFATKDVEGMSKNMYETLKNVVNEDFRDSFSSYGGNAQICWGIDDGATSLSSGEEIAKLIKNSTFYPLEGDHYFFLKKGGEIENLVELM